MINKCHTLPRVYIMLAKSVKFQSLFYYELNEICGNYVWILHEKNYIATKSILFASANFPNNE